MLYVITLITIFAVGSSANAQQQSDLDPEITCKSPFWHNKLGNNWLSPTSKNSHPIFKLFIRGIGDDNIYTPGEIYTVVVKASKKAKTTKRINGFELIVSGDGGDSACGNGTFGKSRGKKATKAVISNECNSVSLDESEDIAMVIGLKWTAPTCGCVTFDVTIKASDDHLYYDDKEDDDIPDEHKVLIQKVCAAE